MQQTLLTAAAISVAQGRESWQNNRSTEAPSL